MCVYITYHIKTTQKITIGYNNRIIFKVNMLILWLNNIITETVQKKKNSKEIQLTISFEWGH